MVKRPDCCYQSSLRTLCVIDEAPDGEVVLDRCENCHAYWRVVVHDPIAPDGSEHHFFEWFQKVSNDQASLLLTDSLALSR